MSEDPGNAAGRSWNLDSLLVGFTDLANSSAAGHAGLLSTSWRPAGRLADGGDSSHRLADSGDASHWLAHSRDATRG